MRANLKIILFILPVLVWNCSVKYSLTGASISAETKTFQVNYFQNNSTLIEPGIDRDFTNKLIDLLINQTSLDLVKSNGDLLYEGEIVEYRISPTTATANNSAAQNRLTVSINVRFFDKSDPEAEFEKRFSFYYDYPGSSQLVGSQKDTAIDEIFERITQDVFNASLAKW
ncbi:MAG TPA: LptE family protein [Flavobacteriaceae bacterium]|nr:LptE family protein [Flavobacteriaceae bacterium]|tara:strand:- start:602 stop:1111 length:510 start_codon:yes stop_codon:yes gene_type:complete